MPVNYPSAAVNLVVALGCEARPLIRHFRLRFCKALGGMRIYGNDQNISLLVAGVGKPAISGACGFLAGMQHQSGGRQQAAWLNIGIAGHGSRPAGEGILVNRVTDQATGRNSYPPVIFNPGVPLSGLVTVEKPEKAYSDAVAYDMEASEFVATVTRFVTSELCQVFKIVSDGPGFPVHRINEEKVAEWMEGQLHIIDHLVQELSELSSEVNTIYGLPDEFHRLAGLQRLTVNQRSQFESLFRRYYALGGSNLSAELEAAEITDGRRLLRRVEELLPGL